MISPKQDAGYFVSFGPRNNFPFIVSVGARWWFCVAELGGCDGLMGHAAAAQAFAGILWEF